MPNTKEVEQAQWDWYGWLCARIPVLKESANKFWIHQCVEDLLKLQALSNPLEQSEKKEEWVSCSERLPYRDGDSSIYCLVMDTYSGIIVRPYNEYHNCWDQEDGDDHYTEAVGGKITHWMPLPNLPKPPKNLV